MMACLSLCDTDDDDVRSWICSEVPEAWKEPNVVSMHKKGKQDKSGNYSPVNLMFILGKIMKWLIKGFE